MANQGTDSVVLEEEIDPDYEPTESEVIEYAKWLGMDLEADKDILWIAREGLKAPLPENWKPCKTTDTGEIYYFNFQTGASTWDHPCDEYYRTCYEEEKRRKMPNNGKTNSKEDKKRKKKEAQDVAEILGMQRNTSNDNKEVEKLKLLSSNKLASSGRDSPLGKGLDLKPLPGISSSSRLLTKDSLGPVKKEKKKKKDKKKNKTLLHSVQENNESLSGDEAEATNNIYSTNTTANTSKSRRRSRRTHSSSENSDNSEENEDSINEKELNKNIRKVKLQARKKLQTVTAQEEEKLADLKEEYRIKWKQLKNELEQDEQDLIDKHERKLANHHSKHENEKKHLLDQNQEDLDIIHSKNQRRLDKMNSDYESQQREYESMLNDLNKNREQLQEKHDNMHLEIENKQAEVKKLRKQLNDEAERIEEQISEQQADLLKRQMNEKSELSSQNQEEISQMKEKHRQRLDTLRQQHEKQYETEDRTNSKRLKTLENELDVKRRTLMEHFKLEEEETQQHISKLQADLKKTKTEYDAQIEESKYQLQLQIEKNDKIKASLENPEAQQQQPIMLIDTTTIGIVTDLNGTEIDAEIRQYKLQVERLKNQLDSSRSEMESKYQIEIDQLNEQLERAERKTFNQDESDELLEQVEQLKEQVEELKQKLKTTNEDADDLRSDLQRSNQQLQDSKNEVMKMKIQLRDTESKLDATKEGSLDEHAEIRRLQARLDDSEKSIADYMVIVDNLKLELHNRNKANSSMTVEMEKLQTELSQSKSEFSQLKLELKDLMNQVASESKRCVVHEENEERLQQRIEQLHKKTRDLENEHKEQLEAERERLKQARALTDTSEAAVSYELESELNSVKLECGKYERRAVAAESKLHLLENERQSEIIKMQEISLSNSNLQNKYNNLSDEYNKLQLSLNQRSNAELSKLNSEIITYKANIADLTAKLANLKEDLNNEMNSKHSVENLLKLSKQEHFDQREVNNKLSQEYSQLQIQLRSLNTTKNSNEMVLSDLTSENKVLNDKISQLNVVIDNSSKIAKANSATIESQQIEILNLNAEIKTLNQDLDLIHAKSKSVTSSDADTVRNMTTKLDSLTEQYQQAMRDKENLNMLFVEEKYKRQQLEIDQAASNSNVLVSDGLINKLSSATADLKTKDLRIHELSTEISSLRTEMNTLRTSSGDLTKSLNEATSLKDSYYSSLHETKSRLNKASSELETLRSKYNVSLNELDEAKTALNSKTQASESLSRKLKNTTNELNQLKFQKQQLEMSMDELDLQIRNLQNEKATFERKLRLSEMEVEKFTSLLKRNKDETETEMKQLRTEYELEQERLRELANSNESKLIKAQKQVIESESKWRERNQDENQLLRNKISELKGEVDTTRGMYETSSMESSQLRQDCALLRKRLESASSNHAMSTKELEAISLSLVDAENKYNQSCVTVNSLKDQVRKLEVEASRNVNSVLASLPEKLRFEYDSKRTQLEAELETEWYQYKQQAMEKLKREKENLSQENKKELEDLQQMHQEKLDAQHQQQQQELPTPKPDEVVPQTSDARKDSIAMLSNATDGAKNKNKAKLRRVLKEKKHLNSLLKNNQLSNKHRKLVKNVKSFLNNELKALRYDNDDDFSDEEDSLDGSMASDVTSENMDAFRGYPMPVYYNYMGDFGPQPQYMPVQRPRVPLSVVTNDNVINGFSAASAQNPEPLHATVAAPAAPETDPVSYSKSLRQFTINRDKTRSAAMTHSTWLLSFRDQLRQYSHSHSHRGHLHHHHHTKKKKKYRK